MHNAFSRKQIIRPAFILWMAVLLAGCQPASAQAQLPTQLSATESYAAPLRFATFTPLPGLEQDCLAGTWELADVRQTFIEANARLSSPLQVSDVNGSIRYLFHEDGTMQIVFDRLDVVLSGNIDDQPVTARNVLEGSANARYQVNSVDEEVVLSNFGGDGIHFRVEVNGEMLNEGDFPSWRAFSSALSGDGTPTDSTVPTRVIGQTYLAARCAGDTLKLQALEPAPGSQMRLKRVE